MNGRRTLHGSTSGVYVLELEGGYVYVGKSGNIQLRMKQHMTGVGSVFTRAHKPTGWFLGRIGNVCGDGDGPERDETLRQMHRKGVHMVRGWKYVGMYLTPSELKDIESNTRELLDLCRICGGEGHFASGCAMRTC